MIRIFTGFDQREAVGHHVFLQSVIERTDEPVEIIPLTERIGRKMGIVSDGSNSFSKIRFSIPYLCGFKGHAIWADAADMLCLEDIVELWNRRDTYHAVKVVKHDYQPTGRKYVGTEMETANEAYPRKNWSSLVLWWNEYMPHQQLTPSFINEKPGSFLHRFSWLPDARIGDLSSEWNHLVIEQERNPNAKLAHFTLGIPSFSNYGDCEFSDEWKKTLQNALEGMQYEVRVIR